MEKVNFFRFFVSPHNAFFFVDNNEEYNVYDIEVETIECTTYHVYVVSDMPFFKLVDPKQLLQSTLQQQCNNNGVTYLRTKSITHIS